MRRRALGADRVLRDLHHDRLAVLQQSLDLRLGLLDLGLVELHVAAVQHAVLGRADVDERGLHARQHVLHLAEIDVAVDRRGVVLRPADVVLDEHPALEHRHLDDAVGVDVHDHLVPPGRAALAGPAPAALQRLVVELLEHREVVVGLIVRRSRPRLSVPRPTGPRASAATGAAALGRPAGDACAVRVRSPPSPAPPAPLPAVGRLRARAGRVSPILGRAAGARRRAVSPTRGARSPASSIAVSARSSVVSPRSSAVWSSWPRRVGLGPGVVGRPATRSGSRPPCRVALALSRRTARPAPVPATPRPRRPAVRLAVRDRASRGRSVRPVALLGVAGSGGSGAAQARTAPLRARYRPRVLRRPVPASAIVSSDIDSFSHDARASDGAARSAASGSSRAPPRSIHCPVRRTRRSPRAPSPNAASKLAGPDAHGLRRDLEPRGARPCSVAPSTSTRRSAGRMSSSASRPLRVRVTRNDGDAIAAAARRATASGGGSPIRHPSPRSPTPTVVTALLQRRRPVGEGGHAGHHDALRQRVGEHRRAGRGRPVRGARRRGTRRRTRSPTESASPKLTRGRGENPWVNASGSSTIRNARSKARATSRCPTKRTLPCFENRSRTGKPALAPHDGTASWVTRPPHVAPAVL